RMGVAGAERTGALRVGWMAGARWTVAGREAGAGRCTETLGWERAMTSREGLRLWPLAQIGWIWLKTAIKIPIQMC
ncbi:MAG: hypothetical protein J6334_11430, partial [Kiritimatiellae bacterium]|nr:hypothetical protein [Kiritimatiellia bacterium]